MLVKYVQHNLVNFCYCIIQAIFFICPGRQLVSLRRFLLCRLYSRVLGLIFLHAKVSVGGFVNWSEIRRSEMLGGFILDTALRLANKNVNIFLSLACARLCD